MGEMGQVAPAQFSLGGNNISMPNNGQAYSQALIGGANVALEQQKNQLQAQQLAQQKQLQDAQIQQSQISQVDSLLKTGLSYPGLLPSFWPTIANKMNAISPDYKLDPKRPPENITTFAKQLSDISDGVQDKVVSPPQAHAAVTQLIGQTFPSVQDHLTDPGQPQPQAIPEGQMAPAAPGPAPVMAPNAGQPIAPPQQSNPIADLVTLKQNYDKASALIAQAPPDQHKELREQLDNSSLGQMYKQTLDQHFKQLSSAFTEDASNKRNEFNQRQDTLRQSAGSFMTQAGDFKNVADNFSSFNHLIQLSEQMKNNGEQIPSIVQAEKTALTSYMQMAYPGSGRPGSPEMMEMLEKSGSRGELLAQSFKRVLDGDVMTDKQVKGLRQTAVALYQGKEAQQSGLETSYMKNIQSLGGDPMNFLKDLRTQGVASTSKLFQAQSTDQDPAIGHITKWSDGTKYQYLGGGKHDKSNWVKIGDSDE